MPKSVKESEVEQAPPRCYQVLSADEFASRVADLPQNEKEFALSSTPLTTFADLRGRTGYPAFQLEIRLDLEAFSKLRQLYVQGGISDKFLWDFLRTRDGDLGGMTGVDFLLGYFDSEVAALSDQDRVELFLVIAREDIERCSQ